jgi:hypothetical protein
MTDDELAAFLGVAHEPFKDKFLAGLTADQRALFDKMRAVELWDQGLGERPEGVIACGHKHSVFGHA